MINELTRNEKTVWCHIFLGACSASVARLYDPLALAASAGYVADEAVKILRERGLVDVAESVVSERRIYAPDDIPVRTS